MEHMRNLPIPSSELLVSYLNYKILNAEAARCEYDDIILLNPDIREGLEFIKCLL